MSKIQMGRSALLCALLYFLLCASQAYAQLQSAFLPSTAPSWLTPNIRLTSNATESEQKRAARDKKAEKTKKKCGWPAEKEWNRCERVKTMPGQPSSCDHLLPKC